MTVYDLPDGWVAWKLINAEDLMISKVETDENGNTAVFIEDAPAYGLNEFLKQYSPIHEGDDLPPVDCRECKGIAYHAAHSQDTPCTAGNQNRVAGPVSLVESMDVDNSVLMQMFNGQGWLSLDEFIERHPYLCATSPEVVK